MSHFGNNFGDNQTGCVDFSFFDDDNETGRSSRLNQAFGSVTENRQDREAQNKTNPPDEVDRPPTSSPPNSGIQLKHGVEVRLPTPEGLISITRTLSEPTKQYGDDKERTGNEGEDPTLKQDKPSVLAFPAIEEKGHTSPCGDNASYIEEPLECIRSASIDPCTIESTKVKGTSASFGHKAHSPPRSDDSQHAWDEVAVGEASQTSQLDAERRTPDASIQNTSVSIIRMPDSLESEQLSVRQLALALKDLSKTGKLRRLRPPWRDPNSRPLPSDEDHLMEDMLRDYNEQMSSNRKSDWPAANIAIHRPYHSTLNRWRQQERIQFENFTIAHRLKNIKASRETSREELLRQYKQYFITPVTAPVITAIESEMVAQGTAVIKSRNSSRPPSASGLAPQPPKTAVNRGSRKSQDSWSNSTAQGRVRAKSAGGKVPSTTRPKQQPQQHRLMYGRRDGTVGGDSRSITSSCSPPERRLRQPKVTQSTRTTPAGRNRPDSLVYRPLSSSQKKREVISQGCGTTSDVKRSSWTASTVK